ncbi:type II secretion system protein GspL [Sinimarinibacterium thermocellulolyticum]|uniref:Type II secretion system protein L n=1 Tax=Sinimarinibacterium thermocellulolyticum TaxID=3170016 RepID=A0ABV2AD77_9GAMM
MRAVDPAAPTAYCIARADALASFPVEHAPLQDLIPLAAGRRVVVLLSSTEVRLCSVPLPVRHASKVRQAVPFALEDQLADDVQTQHFAIGARGSDGHWPVAVIAHERLQAYLGFFTERGVRPDTMIPDLFALPVPEAHQFSLLVDGDEILVRTAAAAGFVCARDDLETCLLLADGERSRQLRVLIARDQDFDPSLLRWNTEPLHGFEHPLQAMLQHLDGRQAIDLLQGEYSTRQDWLRLWQPWRLAAGLAAAAVVLAATQHGVQAWHLGQELDALNERNQQRYREIFPQETRIVDLEAQLGQQLARLQDAPASAEFLALLGVAAEAIAAVPGLRLEALQYREASLYASMRARELQALEQLKAWFEPPRPARLEVQSANAGSEGVQIRIKLSPT